MQVTDRPGFVAFEPSFSPDGQWIVFESHVLDVDGDGALFKVRGDGTQLTQLTDGSGDDRQPNWSPAGGLIVFQSRTRTAGGDWDLFVMDTNGGAVRNVTASPLSEDTDVSFSPDGRRLVYSSDLGGLEFANLFVLSTSGGAALRVTDADRYDGAPSWSPDGSTIAFESYAYGDPDGHRGTAIWTIDAP